MKERRQNKRWRISWQSKIKLEGALTFIDCSISDLSFTGFKVALPPELPRDTFLKLNIMLGKDCLLEDIEVWMAWHKRKESLNLYGFYFSRIKDADKEKIYKFIRNHFPKMLYSQWQEGAIEEDKGIEDRRVFERFKAKLPLRFFNLSEAKQGQAITEDVSAKGVGLLAQEELRAGTALEMWVEVPDKGEPLYLRGEVVWSMPKRINNYLAGIKLEKANLMELSRLLRRR